MFRSHVPTVQAKKAQAILNSAGIKKWATLRVCSLAKWPYFCPCFSPASCQSTVNRERWLLIAKAENLDGWDGVGIRCDPGRARHLLQPRLLAMYRRSTNLERRLKWSRIAGPSYLVCWQSLRGLFYSGGRLVSGQGVGSELGGYANQEAHYTDLKQIPLR